VPGRAQLAGAERIAHVAQPGLGLATSTHLHDLGAEPLGAPARILIGLRAPQAVVDVQRRDVEAELAERVEKAGRVRAA
jgi:hypothetical protein